MVLQAAANEELVTFQVDPSMIMCTTDQPVNAISARFLHVNSICLSHS